MIKRKPPLTTIILIVLTVLLSVASGPIGNAIEVPATIKPLALPLLLTLAFFLSLTAVWQYFSQEQTQEQAKSHSVPSSLQNRQRLLARVRAFWIAGVLEKSLHGAALIALGLRDQPDMLANPWHLVVQPLGQSSRALPKGIRITQVYDDAIGELLILGEPGSGKTTLLLELARDLLSRAERDENHPMPVVFNLSSWAVKRLPLSAWLIEELNVKYQVPRPLGKVWVDAGQVLPLLDGLDEVASSFREACIEAINAFRQEHGLVSIVVCSRSDDYLTLKQRVLLRSAVVVQPLTQWQIEAYLESAGEQFRAVRVALHDDPVLQELMTTPLMLSVLSLTYHGDSGKDIEVSGSLEARRQRLWEDYVQAMLQRRGTQPRYTLQKATVWLTWLAKQLQVHSQTEFYMERMQPDWIPGTQSRRVYQIATGLVFGLGGALVFGLGGGQYLGLVFGLYFGLEMEITPSEVIGWSWRSTRIGLPVGLVVVLFFGLFFGLLGGLLGGLFFGLNFGLVVALVVALVVGLKLGLVAFIKHFILRWFLRREGFLPWNYPRFLDYAAERILLRKVGRGYIFVHRLLLEHFAAQDSVLPSNERI
jgi:DNA polymerase III delta prime subunit